LPSVAELLRQLRSKDEELAEAAALELGAAAQSALPALDALLMSDETDDRWWAVRTLAAMAAPPTEWLRRALDDPNAEVRAAAALALSTHPDPQAEDALIEKLGEEDTVVGALAASALIALGDSVVPALLVAFEEASPRGKIQMLRVLAEVRDHRAIPLMLKATESGSATLDYWAKAGLEALGLDMIYLSPK
jgi:HEAT repeat protein